MEVKVVARTFEEKMAERLKSEEYSERKVTLQKAGGKYNKGNCMSRDQYVKLSGNFQRYNMLQKNSASATELRRNPYNQPENSYHLEHQVSFDPIKQAPLFSTQTKTSQNLKPKTPADNKSRVASTMRKTEQTKDDRPGSVSD